MAHSLQRCKILILLIRDECCAPASRSAAAFTLSRERVASALRRLASDVRARLRPTPRSDSGSAPAHGSARRDLQGRMEPAPKRLKRAPLARARADTKDGRPLPASVPAAPAKRAREQSSVRAACGRASTQDMMLVLRAFDARAIERAPIARPDFMPMHDDDGVVFMGARRAGPAAPSHDFAVAAIAAQPSRAATAPRAASPHGDRRGGPSAAHDGAARANRRASSVQSLDASLFFIGPAPPAAVAPIHIETTVHAISSSALGRAHASARTAAPHGSISEPLRASSAPHASAAPAPAPAPAPALPAPEAKRPYVRYRAFAQQTGLAPRGMPAQGGQRTLLLCKPMDVPPGYKPFVFGLANVPKELAKRQLEAQRIAPALSKRSVASMLDANRSMLVHWPAHTLAARLLNAVCAVASHSRLAAMRCQLYHLNAYAVREYGMSDLEVMRVPVSASLLSDYAQWRDEGAALEKLLAEKRKAERLVASKPRAIASKPPDAEALEAGHGAAAAAISLLSLAQRSLSLQLHTEHPMLVPFRKGRPPTREDGGAVPPEALLMPHLELGAATARYSRFVRGSFGMAALQGHVCVRKALGKRSLRPRRRLNGVAVGRAGMDLKKRLWRHSGRPLLCFVHGWTGDQTWYIITCEVLDEDGFNAREFSLIRAHNGAGGDPRKATAWLDREPTDDEWNKTIEVLCNLDVDAPSPDGGARVVRPHLLRSAGSVPRYSSHSLKMVKISAYVALRVHTDYIVEPGAHAGSQLERLSVRGASALAQTIRPTGLQVAMRYAREATRQTILEVEETVVRAVRSWIAESGLSSLGRDNSWEELARWATARVGAPERADRTLFVMTPSPPEVDDAEAADAEASDAEEDGTGGGEEHA